MTRFNFTQACLLDASGELGPGAAAQLQDRLENSPAAQAAHDQVKAGFDSLRELPAVELSAWQKRQLAKRFKGTVRQALGRRDGERRGETTTTRWRMVYHVLAGALGLAACLGIVVGIRHVVERAEWDRRVAVARAEQSTRDYLNTNAVNLTDYTYNKMERDIQLVEDQQRMAMNEVPRNAMLKLLDDGDYPTEEMPDDLGPGAL